MKKLVRSAKVVVLDGSGRALLLRRSGTHPHAAYAPDLPGGVIEPTESFESGVARELREETNIDISHTNGPSLLYATTRQEENESITRLLYAVRLSDVEPQVQISWEHSEYHWVPLKELVGVEEPYQAGIDHTNQYNLWQTVN